MRATNNATCKCSNWSGSRPQIFDSTTGTTIQEVLLRVVAHPSLEFGSNNHEGVQAIECRVFRRSTTSQNVVGVSTRTRSWLGIAIWKACSLEVGGSGVGTACVRLRVHVY